ncbi:GNAT family N-acetyltransferase [Tsuneonella sp. YG55]|uniref:GNAT family N-acetyltransferase n=1 Tax=Tsuneonella litorea TaxID=2976475 RepID=A0A9X3A9P7_9SPHN|nr:GNAT family N-acetyltransferase [Tsuneonella litorea]MCT2559155.1 GNAT family N-acetyltransferase [Tsuneonella litorea]
MSERAAASARPDERQIHTRLEDGTRVCIRTIRPDDEARMREGIARMSDRSRYMRFFTGVRVPPPHVIDKLLGADGDQHIAWGAIASDLPGEPAIGAVHAIAEDGEPDRAEFSVAVIDDFHDRGLGRLLTATILLDAAEAGYAAFQAWTLAENTRAIGFVKALGAELVGREDNALEYHLPVPGAIEALRAECDPPGLADVFRAFRAP